MTTEVRIVPITGLPEIRPGDDIVGLLLDACRRSDLALADGDILVVTQKIVSKAEGRIVRLADVEPSALARTFAREWDRDPRTVELVLREARRIVKMDRGVLITETAQGFVCSHTGVDASNVPEPDAVTLLPEDPDRSAAALREAIENRTGVRVGVIVSDTFGRPWREGVVNVAVGVAGLAPFADYRGQKDPQGRTLTSTLVAVADELASAAELVMGKLDRVPVALIRGYVAPAGDGRARELVRPAEKDLFR